jgi:hypothetical protein
MNKMISNELSLIVLMRDWNNSDLPSMEREIVKRTKEVCHVIS